MTSNRRLRIEGFAPALLFLALLVSGLCIVRDYGMHWDELQSHYFGVRWYDYVHDVFARHRPLASLQNIEEHDVIHGPAVEMTLAGLTREFFDSTNLRGIIFFRHYCTWTIYCLGVFCFYFLAKSLFASRKLALLACAFLVIHPRIFSHAFYDSVDISFMSAYIFSLYTLVRYIGRRTMGSLCLHAMACAILMDIRIIGGVIPAITCALLLGEYPTITRSFDRWSARIGAYLALMTLIVVVLWPYLWANPLVRILEVIRVTPRINWLGTVLYRGTFTPASRLPWHYVPVWIAITTPVAYSVFFLVGLGAGLTSFLRSPGKYCRGRPRELVVLAAFLLPVLAVILLKAVVYDSWRHLFFVYPAFVLVAVAAVARGCAMMDGRRAGTLRILLAIGSVALVVEGLATTAWFMIRSHPYENVYFNRMAGRDMESAKRLYDLDYWGLSYRAGLEYVLAHDPARPIRIYDANASLLIIETYMLNPEDRIRIQSVGRSEAKYLFTNFRWLKDGYPGLPEYFAVRVEGAEILCVYKAR